MGLYRISGTITRLGQCEFDNDYEIYAYVEVTGTIGRRTLVKKVAVFADIGSSIHQGLDGDFYFDEVFVPGGRAHCQLWGIRAPDRCVIDSVDLRANMMRFNLLCGILFTPVFGAGLVRLIAGIAQMISILTGAADRQRYFDTAIDGPGDGPSPLSDRYKSSIDAKAVLRGVGAGQSNLR